MYSACHGTSGEERKRIRQSIDALSRYDLNAWTQVGFGVQMVLYDAICALPDHQKQALRSVIADMCGHFLDTDLQGTTSHQSSISIHRAAIH